MTLVDTSGAFPGVQAEERGQAEAIARGDRSLPGARRADGRGRWSGEGGSGGAVALAAANRVLMFEHAIYSVISPEGCASILLAHGGQGGRCGAGDAGHRPAACLAGRDRPDRAGAGWAARIANPTVAIECAAQRPLSQILRDFEGLGAGPTAQAARRQGSLAMGG